MTISRKKPDSATRGPRPRNYAATRQSIIDAAIKEFAQHGFTAATTDNIADRAGVTKRLIFYYFKTKSLLFTAVLEYCYGVMRTGELDLRLDQYPPRDALRKLVGWTFEFDAAHTQFLRLVMVENIHLGRHMARSVLLKEMAAQIIKQLKGVLARGKEEGIFRRDLEAVELHAIISSLCAFAVENRYTFAAQFGYNMAVERTRQQHKAMVIELVELFAARK
jgi:AcrR family transcriptional regulator